MAAFRSPMNWHPGAVSPRDGARDAWSGFGFVDSVNRLGIGRAQVDYATDDLRDGSQLTLNQTWNTPPGTRFGSSVLLGHAEFADETVNTFGVALNVDGNIRTNIVGDLNASRNGSDGRASYDHVMVSAAVGWTFAMGWTAGANCYVSRNTFRAPGRGSGSAGGVLFLDEHDNGILDAGEAGAPNIVILLNGHFASRTKSEGRFEFPSVGAGTHVLTVVQDNLP